MATKKKLLQAAAGNAGGGAGLDVEEVFSTFLYSGNGSTRTITNGIDLDGEGGLVWIKNRGNTTTHNLHDTERGAGTYLQTNASSAEVTDNDEVTAFNSNGFSLGDGTKSNSLDGSDYASWTFRKAPKFFDVQTFTYSSGSATTINHSLNCEVGMVIIKRTDSSDNWYVQHRSNTGSDSTGILNGTAAFNSPNGYSNWIATFGTTSLTTVTNQVSGTYVAYIFAHNDGDGEFGPDGDADIIKCGSYSGTGNYQEIDLGFEAQWVMIKRTDSSQDWMIFDVMRGMPDQGGTGSTPSGNDARLKPNTSDAEQSDTYGIDPHANGFAVRGNNISVNGSTYIYIAIRRSTAVPETATEVFGIDNNTGQTGMTTGVVTDFGFAGQRSGTDKYYVGTRLLQGSYLNFNSTASESSSSAFSFDQMDGFFSAAGSWNGYIGYGWKRAPNYMDVVAYSGNGSYPRNISHNLGVVPEMMWVKTRNAADNWRVYSKDMTVQQEMLLNGTYAASATGSWGTGGRPTDSVFIVGSANTNYSGRNYIAYLFASLDGISKVGSYTGNGSFQTIDCGFSAGSRFVLIKRTDATGDWYVWDSVRGITQAADPYLELNTTSAETTGNKNYLYPANSGFGVQEINGTNNPNINVSGATYIFYAIA